MSDEVVLPAGRETAKPKTYTWDEYAAEMLEIRTSKEEVGTNKKGEPIFKEKAKVRLEKEVWEFALKVMKNKGKLFLDAYPFIFLPEESKIVKFHDNGEANSLLFRLGLLITQPHTNLVRENLSQHILNHGTPTRIEKLGCMRGEAIYVNNGRGGAFKIEQTRISEVPNGTDDVYMLAPELTAWPELNDENITRMKEIRTALGPHGGKVGDTTLCKHFNAYFEEGTLNSVQYQQLVLLRYLSLFLGQAIDLRPIMLASGEQNSGKSTLWEKIKWTLEGTDYESASLPTNLRSFTAAITNHQMQIFDNIDSVNFDNPKSDYPAYIDLMCKASTGGRVPIAELYKTNVEKTFDLRCDLFLTARVNPFPSHRSDLGRRTLYFPIRMPNTDEYMSTELMKKQLRADEQEMKLETLVRLQKILKAMLANAAKEYAPITQMHSYENWTMRVAEHEGWAFEMTAIWQGYKGDAQERITDDSAFVDVIRRWIGMHDGGNVGRWARPGEIHHELQMIYERDFTQMWRNPAIFGRRLKENFTALRILGIEKKSLHGGPVYCFTPTPTQIQKCLHSYKDSAPRWFSGDTERVPDPVDVL